MIKTHFLVGPVSQPKTVVRPVMTISGKVNHFIANNKVKVLDVKFSALESDQGVAVVAMILFESEG